MNFLGRQFLVGSFYIKKFTVLLLIPIVFMSSSCGTSNDEAFPIDAGVPCVKPVQVLSSDTVRFCGSSDQATIDELLETLRKTGATKLVVSSIGGETVPAISLGRFINENNIKVYVDSICLSSCSQFVVMGAKDLYLRPDSVLAMHDSQTSTNILVQNIGLAEGMSAHAQEEQRYYNDLSVPLELLSIPTAQIGPICIMNEDDYLATGLLRVKAGYDYYIPSAHIFDQVFPGTLHTTWPQEKDIKTNVKRLFDRLQLKVIFGETYSNEVLPLDSCVVPLEQ